MNTSYLNDLGKKLQFVRGKFGDHRLTCSERGCSAGVQLHPALSCHIGSVPKPAHPPDPFLTRETAPPSPSDDPPGTWLLSI